MAITIYAVGDIMLGNQPLCENIGVRSGIQRNGPDFLFQEISPLLNDGDIVFGNLECSIETTDGDYRRRPSFFSTSADVAPALRRAGFTVLSVANNHIMENGRESFLNTAQSLRKTGIFPVGIAGEVSLLDVQGKKIAFLAYSFIEDSLPDVCYNKVHSEESIIDDVKRIRPDVDLIVVSLHWGYEYVPYPSPEQVRVGRKLIESGVDVILGGHPHVNQGYEIYNRRPIIYSLGNCVFDQTFIETTRESIIAKVMVADITDKITVEIIPIRLHKTEYYPQLVKSPEKETIGESVQETRKAIERRTISEYREFLGDYDQLYMKYKRPALLGMKRQFIRNFFRYSFSTTFNIVRQYAGRHR